MKIRMVCNTILKEKFYNTGMIYEVSDSVRRELEGSYVEVKEGRVVQPAPERAPEAVSAKTFLPPVNKMMNPKDTKKKGRR